MNKKTYEEYLSLLRVYKKSREEISLAILDYKPNQTREKELLKNVDNIIKELEEKSENFTNIAFKREYKDEIKLAENKISKLSNKIEKDKINTLGPKLSLIDERAIDFITNETTDRLIIASQGIKREVITKISAIKQASIRERLGVGLATGESVGNITKDIAKDFRNEGIRAFVKSNGAQMKLEGYVKSVIRNNIQQAHNDASYNRYKEAGIEVVRYSEIGDERVSPICQGREGKYFYLDTVTPLPWGSHFNCRHTLEPVVIIPDGTEIYSGYPDEGGTITIKKPDDKLETTEEIQEEVQQETQEETNVLENNEVNTFERLDTWDKGVNELEIGEITKNNVDSLNETFFTETKEGKMFGKKLMHEMDVSREKLSSIFNNELGIYSPKTINVKGSDIRLLNEFIDGESIGSNLIASLNKQEYLKYKEQRIRLGALDLISGQTDRHIGNIMLDKNKNLIAIDNDMIFTRKDTYSVHRDLFKIRESFFEVNALRKETPSKLELYQSLLKEVNSIDYEKVTPVIRDTLGKKDPFLKYYKDLNGFFKNNKKMAVQYLEEQIDYIMN